MDNNSDNESFIAKKKLLMRINSGELNKNLLYYINEARTSPKDFSRRLLINDDVDEKISNLSLFFKYSSIEVPPLIIEPNLEKCSKELLYHIISIDDGASSLKFNKEEKEKNCLKERLRRLNLEPTYHVDLVIIGVNNSIEALTNILINKNHRKKLLSLEMKYIGIASGLLPSERLCFVIDIVHSFKICNYFLCRKKYFNLNNNMNNNNMNTIINRKNYFRYNNYDANNRFDNDDDTYEEELNRNKINNFNSISNNNKEIFYYDFNPSLNSDKTMVNKKRFFKSARVSPYNNRKNYKENNKFNKNIKYKKSDEIIDLRISNQECICPSNIINLKRNICYKYPKNYKLPVSVSIEKKYAKNQHGEFFPIYSKETKYDDGSILIQPYTDEYCDI